MVVTTVFAGLILDPVRAQIKTRDIVMFVNVYKWDGALRASVSMMECPYEYPVFAQSLRKLADDFPSQGKCLAGKRAAEDTSDVVFEARRVAFDYVKNLTDQMFTEPPSRSKSTSKVTGSTPAKVDKLSVQVYLTF